MGNISSMARASTALDSYVAELGNDISYDKSLSSSRFLKTILARHANGPLVLKIFIKPDPNMSLRLAQRRLKNERRLMASMQNVNTYQMFVETDKAGYLVRQWIGHNLYDRVSVQPYLAEIEKKWIAFQLLTCLRDTRVNKVAHGDIKSENVLVTSDLTVILTDFSYTFKPTYLPIDDPSDFSFFFDTSGRRTCYLAPERFETRQQREQRQLEEKRRLEEKRKRKLAEAKRKADEKRRGSSAGQAVYAEPLADLSNLDHALHGALIGEGDEVDEDTLAAFRPPLHEEMDVFSAGCVLAEMWTDGRTVFNLSEMFAYKDGSLGLEGVLDNIGDKNVRGMIGQMLSLEPSDRLKFDRILSDYRGTVFPEYFYTFLQDYVTSLSETPRNINPEAAPSAKNSPDFLQQCSPVAGTRIDRMLAEWESVLVHLEEDKGEGAALLLLNLVTSSIRHCTWPQSRLHGLELFVKLLQHVSDEDKVDRMIPFAVELLKDSLASIRSTACRTIVIIIESLNYVTPSNAAFIPEYLLPLMRELTADPDVSVRATYAGCLVQVADAARNVLELIQAAKTSKADPDASGIIEPDYDEMLAEIIQLVEEHVTIILRDEAVPVKCAILASIPSLCVFFGRQKSSDTVLSHLVTYLNDREWQLRLAFFASIVQVGPVIGLRAVEDYVLPLMLQSLADPEEAVVAQVIQGFISLDRDGWVKRMSRWDIFAAVRGFLCHPNSWIRQGAAGYVAAAATALPPADVWCILYPNIRPLLRHDIVRLDEHSILSALLLPLSRAKLVAARTAALENRPEAFWSAAHQRGSSKQLLTRSALNERLSQAPQMRDKDIGPEDERKIVAMRDFIAKQSQSVRRRHELDSSQQEESRDLSTIPACLGTDRIVELGGLGVLPQTVFISPRTVNASARSDIRRLRPTMSHGVDTPSRRTSVAGRSAKMADSPIDEIRKRLQADVMANMSSANSAADPNELDSAATPSDPSGSGFELGQGTRMGRVRVDPKAAPAVAAVHTNVLGMTSLHEDLMSGQTTPTAGVAGSSRLAAIPGNTGYGSSYDGHDPGVKAFLEQVDLQTYREPLLDFGPKVVASQRKRPRSKNNTASPITLIAHLTQHTGSIVGIVTSPDQAFFVTASTDKSVLVWDSGRLERSVSAKPRLSYIMDAPVSAICRIENTHCVVVCAEDGQLHVLRMHVGKGEGGSAKYGKVECIRTWISSEQDIHVTHVSHLSESTLLVVTSNSLIATLDIRSMTVIKRFQNPPEMGMITAVLQATDWLLAGTELGILNLWDLRFGLLLKSWRVGGSVTSLDAHPTKGHGRWVICGVHRKQTTSPLVEVYDVETSRLVEIYESRSDRPSSKSPFQPNDAQAAIPDRSQLVAELAEKRASIPDFDEDRPAVLCLATGSRFASLPPPDEGSILDVRYSGPAPQGYLITAGQDKVVRYFDLAKPADGMVICGSAKQKDVVFKSTSIPALPPSSTATPTSDAPTKIAAPSNITLTYTLPRASDKSHASSDPRLQERQKMENVRETLGGRQPLRPHFDAICALGTVETGVSSCVISGDRGGVVKVWRVEGGGK